jgi:hypothetical protein
MQAAHGFGTMLFDVENDPKQEHLLVDDEVERRMIGLLIEWMKWNDSPREQFERLGLPFEGPVQQEHLLLARQKAQALKAREKRVPLPPYTGPGAEYMETPLKVILTMPGGQPLVEKYFPFLLNSGSLKMIAEASLKQITGFMAGSVTQGQLTGFLTELSAGQAGEEAGNSSVPTPAQTPEAADSGD